MHPGFKRLYEGNFILKNVRKPTIINDSISVTFIFIIFIKQFKMKILNLLFSYSRIYCSPIIS